MLVWIELLAALLALCSIVPAITFAFNILRYRAPRFGAVAGTRVSVLIPVRDDEARIRQCLQHVLASRDVELEVLVLDDDSADRSANVVRRMAAKDQRVQLLHSVAAPSGWNTRHFACWQLANAATAPLMLFLEPEVRLDPWAIARSVAALKVRQTKLVSGFPRLLTGGALETLLLPMLTMKTMLSVRMGQMRKTTLPEYAAGCAQFLLADRDAYFVCGGHAAIRNANDAGLRLSLAFREHGLPTDLVDLSGLAESRPFDSARAAWLGVAASASEDAAAGQHTFLRSLLWTAGQVLPLFALVAWVVLLAHRNVVINNFADALTAIAISFTLVLSLAAGIVPRLVAARRFRQSFAAAWLHPVSVLLLDVVGIYAWACEKIGRPVAWQTRHYTHEAGEELV